MLPEMKRQLLGGWNPSASVAAATTTSNTFRDHSRLGRDTRGGRTMGDIWCEILLHVGFRSCRQTNGVKKALMEEISVNQSGDVLKSTGAKTGYHNQHARLCLRLFYVTNVSGLSVD